MQQDKRSIESTDSEDSRLQHTESNVTKYEEIIATPLNAISKDKHEGQQEGMNVAGGYVAVMEDNAVLQHTTPSSTVHDEGSSYFSMQQKK